MVTSINDIRGDNRSPNGILTMANFHEEIEHFLDESEGDYCEIGVFWGGFLTKLAINYPEKKIIGIDPFVADGYTGQPKGTNLDSIESIFLKNIEGLFNVVFYKKTSNEFLNELEFDSIQNVSVFLVDGSHHYDDIVIDIEIIKQINNSLKKLIIFDDLHIHDVVEGINYFEEIFQDRIIKDDPNLERYSRNNYAAFYIT